MRKCHTNDEGTPSLIHFEVRAASSSANAPDVECGSSCAQVLAVPLSAGFLIDDIEPWSTNAVGTYCTLERDTTD